MNCTRLDKTEGNVVCHWEADISPTMTENSLIVKGKEENGYWE